jgi:hypothetical protein
VVAGALHARRSIALEPGRASRFEVAVEQGRAILRCRCRAGAGLQAGALLREWRRRILRLIERPSLSGGLGFTPLDVIGATPDQQDLDAVLNALTEA